MNKNTNILNEIVKTKRSELEALKAVRPLETLQKEASGFKYEKRPFRALFTKGPVLIAEIKPRSPSAGELIADSPLEIADLYAKSEADVISVLTDADYFGGSNDLLKQIRTRVPQAILRKDFIIDKYQVYETLLLKADVYLLIAAILEKDELAGLIALGRTLRLDALVETHDENDVRKALGAGAGIIGVNNRDLTTFNIDIRTTERLIGKIPKNIIVLSESGIETAEDVKRVRKCGASGILVGTSVLQSGDPIKKISELKKAMYV